MEPSNYYMDYHDKHHFLARASALILFLKMKIIEEF